MVLRRAGWGGVVGVSMDRITQAFARAHAAQRAAFVAYLCAGDPDPETSLAACRAVVQAGTDVLELGVPFSDPLADGLTNQLAAQRALDAGVTSIHVFELVRRLRAEFPDLPIVFYTYYNLIHAAGIETYLRRAREAGVDGLLTLDLPPEEAAEVSAACAAEGLKTVFIVAPTTPEARLSKITAAATGFIYYVSRTGVTGVRDSVAADVPAAVARIKVATQLPVVVGFGISTRPQVAEVARAADGVVVGSVLVNVIRDHLAHRAEIPAALGRLTVDLVAGTAR
jgi:tryptophan synthase alpha chain